MNRKHFRYADRVTIYQKCYTDGAGHCAYCGAKLELRDMQVDHLIPVELGDAYATLGVDVNGIDNLYPACRSCNNYKHSMTIDKFRVALMRMPEVLRRDSTTFKIAERFGLVEAKPQEIVFFFERRGGR